VAGGQKSFFKKGETVGKIGRRNIVSGKQRKSESFPNDKK